MLTTESVVADSEKKNTIKIGHKRLNGLLWHKRKYEVDKKIPGLDLPKTAILDIVLKEMGIEELTDEELDLRLRQIQVEVPA